MTLKEASHIFIENIDLIGMDMVDRFASELEGQGHRASGELINSIAKRVAHTINETVLYIEWLGYGQFVNDPLPASKVPFSRGSGARISKFIQEIADWVRRKKITSGLDKDVMKTTFAIATKMKKEGRPTVGSYRFSRNGRRTGWIDYVINKYETNIELRAELAFSQYISNSFLAVIEEKIISSNSKYITIK